MTIKEQLAAAIGARNVLESPGAMSRYGADHSAAPAGGFKYVARARNVDEVKKVLKLANEARFPVVPASSGFHLYGNAVPREGGVVLDLQKMHSIRFLDELNLAAEIEAGVTWEQFQMALAAKGYRSIMPLLPHASRSVITDWLEREPPVVQVTELGEPLLSLQVVWGTGEEFVSGSASINNFRKEGCYAEGVNPAGPGSLSYYRLLEGAQGTMGVVTWGIVKIEPMPALSKALFMPVARLEEAIEPVYKLLRRRIGYECMIVNDVVLAGILAGEGPGQVQEARKVLPPWTVVMVLGALHRRPEEKIAYEEQAIEDIRQSYFPALKVLSTLPGMPAVETRLPEMLRRPWPKDRTYWKHAARGGCQSLMFLTTLEQAPGFVPAVMAAAARHQFGASDVGCYVQPLENGHACQVEFQLLYDPRDEAETARVRRLHLDAASKLLDMGAFFNRPYWPVADMVYRRAGDYTAALKKVKKIFDPNGIMNPGHLCF